jgi:hypothetical protein
MDDDGQHERNKRSYSFLSFNSKRSERVPEKGTESGKQNVQMRDITSILVYQIKSIVRERAFSVVVFGRAGYGLSVFKGIGGLVSGFVWGVYFTFTGIEGQGRAGQDRA